MLIHVQIAKADLLLRMTGHTQLPECPSHCVIVLSSAFDQHDYTQSAVTIKAKFTLTHTHVHNIQSLSLSLSLFSPVPPICGADPIKHLL